MGTVVAGPALRGEEQEAWTPSEACGGNQEWAQSLRVHRCIYDATPGLSYSVGQRRPATSHLPDSGKEGLTSGSDTTAHSRG